MPEWCNGETFGVAPMYQAAELYLQSKRLTARSVEFMVCPGAPLRLLVWTEAGMMPVVFVPKGERLPWATVSLVQRLGTLGHTCAVILAETPAHAVKQMASRLDIK